MVESSAVTMRRRRLDDDGDELLLLVRMLYSWHRQGWDGDKVWQALRLRMKTQASRTGLRFLVRSCIEQRQAPTISVTCASLMTR